MGLPVDLPLAERLQQERRRTTVPLPCWSSGTAPRASSTPNLARPASRSTPAPVRPNLCGGGGGVSVPSPVGSDTRPCCQATHSALRFRSPVRLHVPQQSSGPSRQWSEGTVGTTPIQASWVGLGRLGSLGSPLSVARAALQEAKIAAVGHMEKHRSRFWREETLLPASPRNRDVAGVACKDLDTAREELLRARAAFETQLHWGADRSVSPHVRPARLVTHWGGA